MPLLQWGVSLFPLAPATRERLAVSRAELSGVLGTLSAWPEVQEAVVLATCQRLEIYLITRNPAQSQDRLANWSRLRTGGELPCESRREAEARGHLFAVAAGKASLTLGEPEILRQLREAWRQSWEAGVSGPELNGLFQHALRAGKAIRHRTAISQGRLSLESLVLSQAAAELGMSVPAVNWLIMGLGEMGQSLLRQLRVQGAQQVRLINRSPMADTRLSPVEPWSALPGALNWAQAILVCTGAARPVLTPELLPASGPAQVIVDLAVPHNVDPLLVQRSRLKLLTLADFAARLEADSFQRQVSLPEVDRLLADFLLSYQHGSQARHYAPELKALYDWIDAVSRHPDGHPDPKRRRELRASAHPWVQTLKQASPSLSHAALRQALADLTRPMRFYEP